MPDASFEQAFAQNATSKQIALCTAVQRPIALKSIQEKVAAPGFQDDFHKKPAWYLLAEEDRMINPQTQHFNSQSFRPGGSG